MNLHREADKHKKAMTVHQGRQSIIGLLGKGRPGAVVFAETKMAMSRAKQNIPFTFCDEINKSVKDRFPDSELPSSSHMGNSNSEK